MPDTNMQFSQIFSPFADFLKKSTTTFQPNFAQAVCFPIKVIIQILQTWEYGILNFYIRFSCWIPSGFHFPPKPYEQPPPFFATYTYAGFIFNFFERSDPLETVVVFKFLQMTSNLIILFFWLCYLHSNHKGSVRYKG